MEWLDASVNEKLIFEELLLNLVCKRYNIVFWILGSIMLQSENKGSKLSKHKKYMLVRYGRMGSMGWFEHSESHLPRVHTRVVVKTERGLEMGEVVGPHCYKAGQFKLTEEQVEKYYHDSGAEKVIEAGGTLERFATAQDIHEEQKLNESAKEELECCRKTCQGNESCR